VSVGLGRTPVELRSEEEVLDAVRRARARGGGLRVAGSGGSKSEVTSVPDTAVRLSAPDRLLDVTGNRVTVPAGMTTGCLQELLRREGLTLPTVGEWRNASVAGAMATATHGGSAYHGIMPTSMTRARIVTGTGEVREVEKGDPDFPHLAVSLGAFGVVTEVTVECTEHFSLEMRTDVVSFEDYLRDPVAQESRNEFHASVWMPEAGQVIRFGAEPTRDPERPVPRRTRFGKWTAMARFIARRLGFHRALSARLFQRTAVGDCADILTPLNVPPRVARFRNVANEVRNRKASELAVDAGRAAEALARFEELFREHAATLNNPIGLRMSAADDLTLSPCLGRASLWLDVFYDGDDAFEEDLARLADELDARCHWGKALPLPAGVLKSRYPGWEAFEEARARFDPDEVFSNALTDALGLTGGATARGDS